MDFENKKSSQDIHYSRYLASYLNELWGSGKLFRWGNFYRWLLSIGLSKEEAREIEYWSSCGKLELEGSAEEFIKDLED